MKYLRSIPFCKIQQGVAHRVLKEWSNPTDFFNSRSSVNFVNGSSCPAHDSEGFGENAWHTH
jgi:hypothetical protein